MGRKIKEMPVQAVVKELFHSPSRAMRIFILSAGLLAAIPVVAGDGFIMQDDVSMVDVDAGQIWIIKP
jgi:hypothetical protein